MTHGKSFGALVVLVLAVCACSQQETARSMARRRAPAGRVMITNSMRQCLSLTTEETTKVIHASATAQRRHEDFSCSPGPWLGFFQGTDLLGGFNACDKLLRVDQGLQPARWRKVVPYFDVTGTL